MAVSDVVVDVGVGIDMRTMVGAAVRADNGMGVSESAGASVGTEVSDTDMAVGASDTSVVATWVVVSILVGETRGTVDVLADT